MAAVTASALWSINHYTASIEKTQCNLAILLQKLRHTQRISSRFSLHQFGGQVLDALRFSSYLIKKQQCEAAAPLFHHIKQTGGDCSLRSVLRIGKSRIKF